VISPHAIETVKASMANTPSCGVVTDVRNHLALKVSPVLIQYFDWKKGRLQAKLDVQSKPNERAQTITQYVHGTIETNHLVSKGIAFSDDT
jgi:hypothetical protein